jgi:hypothetical protein
MVICVVRKGVIYDEEVKVIYVTQVKVIYALKATGICGA